MINKASQRFIGYLLVLLLFTACNSTPSNTSPIADSNSAITVATYQGVGIIEGLQPEKSKLRINHEAIKGYMEAMTMDFPVKDRSLLQDLKVGDKIDFTLEYQAGIETITVIKKR